MKASSINIERSVRAITCYLVEQLCLNYDLPEDKALCTLVKTATYDLLQNKKAYLYAESPQYVYSLLEDEIHDNVDSWLEI